MSEIYATREPGTVVYAGHETYCENNGHDLTGPDPEVCARCNGVFRADAAREEMDRVARELVEAHKRRLDEKNKRAEQYAGFARFDVLAPVHVVSIADGVDVCSCGETFARVGWIADTRYTSDAAREHMSASEPTGRANRSRERAEFLSDVLTSAVEGGISYWAYSRDYRLAIAAPAQAWSSVTVHEHGDEAEPFAAHSVTIATIARGFTRMREIHAEHGHYSRELAAYADADAGELDSGDADSVLQLGLFGDVRYG